VTEGVDVPPTVAEEVEDAPVQPVEVTEEPKVQSDDQMEEEWEEVRGRRRSRSRSGEGRGNRVKRTCGSGEEVTPLPKNRFVDGGRLGLSRSFLIRFFYS